MATQKIIFCEGKNDLDILKGIKLKENLSYVSIQSTGGKHGMKDFVRGFVGAGSVNAPKRKIPLRDRDFDFLPDFINTKLLPSKRGDYEEFILHRIIIENYLIDFQLLTDYNKSLKRPLPQLKDVAACKTLFDEAANDLIYYSAIRHALGAIRAPIARLYLPTSLAEEGKQLPSNLSETPLINQAKLVITAYLNQKTARINHHNFATRYDYFLSEFQKTGFMQNSRYLEFFHAEALLARANQILDNKGGLEDAYLKYAIKNFNYTKFPDWVEFVELLKT